MLNKTKIFRKDEIILKRFIPLSVILFMLTCAIFALSHDFQQDAKAASGDSPALFYTYDELVDRLHHIETVSGGEVRLEVIGQSNLGRDIYLAAAGTGDIPVMIVTQQHGTERHGTQSALNLLEELGASDHPDIVNIRDQLTVYILPRLNLDGGEPGYYQRYNVDPDVPPGESVSGVFGSYRLGWNINSYHTINWQDHPLYSYNEFALMSDELGFIPGLTFTGSVDQSGETGYIIPCGRGAGPDDFPAEVEGNLALIETGEANFNEKTLNAGAAGAAGVIFYHEDPGKTILPRLTLDSPPGIPVMAIPGDRALEILEHEGSVTAHIFCHTYPDNPATEAAIMIDKVLDIMPLWIIDSHNQRSYISPGGKTVTSSVFWGNNQDVCPAARDLAKKICVAMVDHMDQFDEAEVTLYPGSSSPGITRNAYGIAGIAAVLMEHWNNFTNRKIAQVLIDHAYEQMLAVLQKTADGTLFEIDPAGADQISLRGESTSRAAAEMLIEPLLPVTENERQAALQDALAAIEAIPHPLTEQHMMEVRHPRALVEKALKLGVPVPDIYNLEDLVAAEEEIEKIYHQNYMRHSILDLPAPAPPDNRDLSIFIRNRAERWWLDDRAINGARFLPLGSSSTSYENIDIPRWAEYQIGGRGYSHVKGYVGISDYSYRDDCPVTFQIHADGDLIFEKTVEFGEPAGFYLLEIEDVEKLRFGWYAEKIVSVTANEIVVVEPQFLIPICGDMLEAIDAVEAIIDSLPGAVSLLDEPTVEAARSVVEEAFALGVEREGRIGNLEKLVAAEETIRQYYHDLYHVESLFELGPCQAGNTNWFGRDFDDPARWDVDTNTGHTVNLVSFAPLKAFYSSFGSLDSNPRWAEWDISGRSYRYVEGYAGISDNSFNLGMPLQMTIYGDGEPIYTERLDYGGDAVFYRLDLEGTEKIRYQLQAATEHVTDSGAAERPVIVEPRFLHTPRIAGALASAEGAIAALPSEIKLSDKEAVEAARVKVNNALAVGVIETEIGNLEILAAAENRIAELEAGILFGDVDGNGVINLADVIILLRHILGLVDLEQLYGPDALVRARFSGAEGPPDIGDAVQIMQYILTKDRNS